MASCACRNSRITLLAGELRSARLAVALSWNVAICVIMLAEVGKVLVLRGWKKEMGVLEKFFDL